MVMQPDGSFRHDGSAEDAIRAYIAEVEQYADGFMSAVDQHGDAIMGGEKQARHDAQRWQHIASFSRRYFHQFLED